MEIRKSFLAVGAIVVGTIVLTLAVAAYLADQTSREAKEQIKILEGESKQLEKDRDRLRKSVNALTESSRLATIEGERIRSDAEGKINRLEGENRKLRDKIRAEDVKVVIRKKEIEVIPDDDLAKRLNSFAFDMGIPDALFQAKTDGTFELNRRASEACATAFIERESFFRIRVDQDAIIEGLQKEIAEQIRIGESWKVQAEEASGLADSQSLLIANFEDIEKNLRRREALQAERANAAERKLWIQKVATFGGVAIGVVGGYFIGKEISK